MTSRAKPQVSGNVSLKKILGSTTRPVVSAWQPSSAGDNNNNSQSDAAAVEDQGLGEIVEGNVPVVSGDNGGGVGNATATTATAPTKGKKGKAKQKQTLFTLGSFPT